MRHFSHRPGLCCCKCSLPLHGNARIMLLCKCSVPACKVSFLGHLSAAHPVRLQQAAACAAPPRSCASWLCLGCCCLPYTLVRLHEGQHHAVLILGASIGSLHKLHCSFWVKSEHAISSPSLPIALVQCCMAIYGCSNNVQP